MEYNDIFYMVSTGGKPCWSKEFFVFENILDSYVRDRKQSLIRAKSDFPNVKVYYVKMPDFYQTELGRCRVYGLLVYKYSFEKELFKKQYGLTYNKSTCDWATNGLLYGYSRDQIQSRYDENLKKFPDQFSQL